MRRRGPVSGVRTVPPVRPPEQLAHKYPEPDVSWPEVAQEQPSSNVFGRITASLGRLLTSQRTSGPVSGTIEGPSVSPPAELSHRYPSADNK